MPQVEKKEIYSRVAEKHNISPELVAEVGDAVFQAWSEWQRHPTNLILKIKNLGKQYVRKKKVKEEIDHMFSSTFDYIDEDRNTFTSEEQYLRYQNNKEWYHTMINMRDAYTQYDKRKKEIRDKRNAVQRPLKDVLASTLQQKVAQETSQDNPK